MVTQSFNEHFWVTWTLCLPRQSSQPRGGSLDTETTEWSSGMRRAEKEQGQVGRMWRRGARESSVPSERLPGLRATN